ncbi:MAG TPA: DUF3857 domain-containing protein [Terriglobales bacterium]|nr:DUF3857 domain-containing protein [Terriglobales bacterium]
MFRLGKWLLLSFLCGLAVPSAHAGFQPPSPDELKMTSEPQAPGAPAIILFRQVDRDDNIHTPHEDNYIRIKILTEEGRKYADVEIPFFKENSDIVNIRARSIRPDGSVKEFDGKVFEKSLVKGRFEGRQERYLAKTFTLPDVEVGSIIEYYYTIDFREYTLFDSHWFLSHELFTKKAAFTLKPFVGGGMYPNYYVRWSWNNLPVGTTPPKEGPRGTIDMEASNIPAFPSEDYMPPPDELKSRVDFIYEEGIVNRDQAKYWKDLGKKRDGQLESFVGKQKEMQQVVAQIVSPADAPEVKLRKIYDRVQQIRNTSFEVEKTEQQQKREKEKPAENVAEVWKRGYGNGVQLTWLFLALARAAGFEAYGCWVSGRNEYFFTPVTMQGEKLNANVVLVKLNGKDLYLDPGGAFTPFGLLEWYETGVSGLKLDRDGGSWIVTTLPLPSESRIEKVAKLTLSDTGELEGQLTITYTGLEAASRRIQERHSDDVARKKYLEDSAISEIAAAGEAELTNKPDWANSETPLVAEFKLKVPGWISNAGSRAMIPAAMFTAGERTTFEHTNRVHPIYFQFPHEKVDDITIQLPPGWRVSSIPKSQEKDAHVINYQMKVEADPSSLHLTRKVSIDIMMLQAKYYPALRDFFEIVRTGDGEQIMLQPGEVHAGTN